MKIPAKLDVYKLFSALGIFILGLEFLAIILALLGFFYWPILAIYIFCGFIFLIYIGSTKLQNYTKVQKYKKYNCHPREGGDPFPHHLVSTLDSRLRGNDSKIQLFSVSLISILFIIFLSSSAEPTVFSGRDQGSFSEAAIRLSQNHRLEFETPTSKEFFKIYGPGTALNFPGFNYTTDGKLITHFSIGYIAWLAIFYSLFGLNGLAIANGILFFLFLISFFLLAKIHSNAESAFFAFALTLSSFVFSWFFKFTLSENLVLGLIWFGILEFSLFLKYRDHFFLFSALGAFLILAFTRIEAWAFLLALAVVFFIFYKKDKKKIEKINRKILLWLLGIFFIIFLINLKVNSQFYLSSLKGLINSFSAEESSLSSVSALSYLLKIFYYYNILPFLLIGLTGISYFIWKKRYDLLVPFFIILPIFIYLIHPGISIDHPWMLRRFSFAIIPLGIFCAVLIIDRLFSKKLYFFPLAFILVAGNLFFSTPYWNFSENKNLLAQTKTLSENFDNNDLILVDRLASGNGWSMISGPLNFLYGKQAAYFFNPTDLDKIDATKFDNIYFIIPDQSLALYEKFGLPEKLIPQKDYSLQRSYLDTTDIDTTSGIFSNLPLKSESVTQGKIYLLKK
ncbi:TPA: hypothetical protein DCL22_00350 [Candidatus Moranbacteria bacterium]|nr:hypothetical protein [Candidatus Moranbacteria bacterium]